MKKLKIIAIAVAVALIFSGCSSMFTRNEDRVQAQAVATVNGVNITRQQVEFEAQQSQEYQFYASNYGVTEETISEDKDLKEWYQDLLSRALDQMVINELLVQKAPEIDVALDDEEKQEQRKIADDLFNSVKDMIRIEVEMEMAPSPSPEVSVSPDVSASPEASVTPEVSVSPEASVTPEVSVSPEASASPEASVTPEVSASPEASVTPEVSASPEASVSPEVSASPEASPSPTATPDPAVEAEVEKRYQEMIAGMPFTPDSYYDYLCKQQLVSKVLDRINEIAEVTDEDVKNWYNESVTAQQTAMEETPSLFVTNMNNNQICVYVPEDTVAVKQVLVTYKDKDLAETAKQSYANGKTEEAMKLLEGQIAELMPQMRDIQQRLKNGESIDALIAEYNEDPGMTSGTAATIGYLVGPSTTTFLEDFTKAAQGLTVVGQVSEPVATYYGVHVLQAIKIYKEGIIPFDELKDSIKTALLPTKQQQKYDEFIEKWKKESNITYDKGRLNN